jgi:Nucleotidyl transferase AbiEii toxin, Type IV TA system
MNSFHPEILAHAQRRFWEKLAPRLPQHWVLYGGTAVALRYGHRKSVDFDFFSDQPLDQKRLHAALPSLAGATVLEQAPRTLVVLLRVAGKPIKLSFFGGMKIGRVGDPEHLDGGPWIASPLDLLATKLKTLHDRIEARDYIDIETLLRGGAMLDRGIAAACALFGAALNSIDTAKAVGWFEEGDLARRLSPRTRSYLKRAAAGFQPDAANVRIKSRSLSLKR